MGKKIYVGNLAFSVTNDTLGTKFAQFGTVESAKVVFDRDTNRSKGFGFVEMSTDEEARNAIESLDGSEFEGRQMKVNEAKPQAPREGGSFGGSRGGGFGGNRGGDRGGDRGGFGGGNRNRY